ncbi:hypothetical protein BTS2_2548 [Bacillus sp. TS-2]|nr:hypothetical protein BTS2_2548 [Bacillus sp. TS-2]
MQEKKMILKMIEDGKITAEEGIKLLEAMESGEKQSKSKESTNSEYLSTDVNWDEGEEYRERNRETSSTASNKLADFFDTAIKKIKDFDLDFNFGSSVNVDHVFQHTSVSPHSIDVSLENGSVDLLLWDEEDVRIECKAKVYRVRDTDEARKTLLEDTTFKVDDNKLLFHTKSKSIKVNTIVYLPKKKYEHIKLYTFNGQISGDDLDVKTLNVHTLNGPIYMNHVASKKVHAETVNGAIQLKYANIELVDAKTVNGAITATGKIQDADLETVNGTITYDLDPLSDPSYLDAKATTGSIHLSLPEDIRAEAKLKSNVGGYTIHLEDYEILEEKKEFAQKSITFVSNQEASPRLKIYALTNTGSIVVKKRD